MRNKLLNWYSDNKRILPFRGSKDPYKIWLSEVMLQQTQVSTVLPFYNKWIRRFPRSSSLIKENINTVLKYWEGLGYYKRCNNFYKANKIVVKDFDGKVPKEKAQFMALPGVGEYTASAVMSIAFNQPCPVFDVNVKRVMARLLGFKNITSYNEKRIKGFLEKNICKNNPGDFNQAMMDLGALVCKPNKPCCHECPLQEYCHAYKSQNPEQYPIKRQSKQIPHYDISIGIIWRGNKFYIQKRNIKGMLGGLWEFPGGKIKKNETKRMALKREIKEECGIQVQVLDKIGSIKHSYSHFKITIYCFYCKELDVSLKLNQNARMIAFDEIKKYPFPKANHKIFKLFKHANHYV